MWEQTRGWSSNKGGKQAGMCLRNVRMGFDIPSKYDDAWTAWLHTEQHKDRNYPEGVYAPIFFSYTATIDGIKKNYGHIGVRYPDGRFWSDGKLYASVETYENNYPPKFVGWGESINDVRVITLQGAAMEKVDLNTARILASGVGFRDGYDGRPNAHNGDTDNDLKNHVGQPLTNAYVYGWFQSKEAGNGRDKQHKAYQARDNALKQVGKLESTNSKLQKALGIKDAEIERLTALLAAKGDDKEVSISAALKILVQAVKDAWFNK